MPEVKAILGQHLLAEDRAEDVAHNTDLMVLGARHVRVAVRVRRYEHLERHGNDFTIRAGRPNGTPTELSKVISGWGDLLFYGFSDRAEAHLGAWFIGDLNVFRLWFQREIVRLRGELPGTEISNADGTSFRAFDRGALPPEFIIAEDIGGTSYEVVTDNGDCCGAAAAFGAVGWGAVFA